MAIAAEITGAGDPASPVIDLAAYQRLIDRTDGA